MNGADLLCDTLLANGVEVCFANPGTSEMHFVAALDRKPAMRCVLGLFEGVVTGAADGYARMADKPAATLLHLGPGLANGLANLHNARRAQTPVVNIVGDHATDHRPLDSPLTTDIEALARPMSRWVHTTTSVSTLSADAASAIATTRASPARSGQGTDGRVATLILPADVAWSEVAFVAESATLAPKYIAAPPDRQIVQEAVRCLRNGRRTLLLLSGEALRGDALALADAIARATGATLLAQQSNARIERGAGRVPIQRVPYGVDQAVDALAGFEQTILVGAKPPVAFFAYPGKRSRLLPAGCEVVTLAQPGGDARLALEALADALCLTAADRAGARVAAAARPERPTGKLNPAAVMVAVARLLPEHAIVCDEAITAGAAFFGCSAGSAPHDFLQLTGGAIGSGIPLATGAAIACPARKVVCLQADGSAMFTLQALWTQARERLDVVTVILANRSYAILHDELRKVGAAAPGPNASRMLDLVDPALDWVGLATAMGVEAVSVESVGELEAAFVSAVSRSGPFLIQAVL